MLFEKVEVPPQFEPFLLIQDSLQLLESHSISEVVNRLENLIPEKHYQTLANEICYIPAIRPFLIDKICDFCIELSPKLGNDFKKCMKISLQFHCIPLMFRLMNKGYFTIDEIASDLIKSGSIRILVFVPAFETSGIDASFQIHNDYSHLKLNDNKCIKEVSEYGWEKESIGWMIKYDDEDMLLQKSSSPSFNWKEKIVWSPFEWSFQPFSKQILAVAAHFGSLKCFKQILLHIDQISQPIFLSSISGGNNEIIHICSSSINDSFGIYSASLQYRRYELFDWLISKYPQFNMNSPECIFLMNLRAFFYVYKMYDIGSTDNVLFE